MLSGIQDLLRQHIGLEASTIGVATVESIIRDRLAAAGARTTDEYLTRLRSDPTELQALIEAVVVPESWFFRDGAPFTALANWARERWLPTHPAGTLRVLTVPCSTGEEPYTVAMTLLDAGLPPERFTVDAVDISEHAVRQARQAVYGQRSFRGEALDFRDRYFVSGPEGYALAEAAQRPVRFEIGNLLAPGFRPGAGRFDVVFCRNLLIYFDRPTQTRAVHVLAGLLAPDGLLFVGYAESNAAASAGFTSAQFPHAFAFRKVPAVPPLLGAPRPTVTTMLPRVPPRSPCALPAGALRSAPARPPATRFLPASSCPAVSPMAARLSPAVPAPSELSAASLDAARALADQGKLLEAAHLCEDHLRRDAASASGWYLLGVVRDAAGDPRRAAECYAKTLYLEPDHCDALLRRALLAEGCGDLAAAAQFRRRIARVQERTPLP